MRLPRSAAATRHRQGCGRISRRPPALLRAGRRAASACRGTHLPFRPGGGQGPAGARDRRRSGWRTIRVPADGPVAADGESWRPRCARSPRRHGCDVRPQPCFRGR